MSRVEIKDNQILVNGEKFRLISGSIHYFRVVPEYWRDRLEKLVNMGCNTVETYIPWNMHEPKKGEFHFEGICDVERFIDMAQELGLYVVLRPSPYICAEWEFGGFPAWLLAEDGMKLRCAYEPYQRAVEDYFKVLIPMLAKHQIDQGGPVIMMQVENEYGYYGNDHTYMEWMANLMKELGVTVPLFTSDGPYDEAFRCGKIPGLLHGGNFGSRAEERFDFIRKYEDGPISCMEFWLGWFDHWGCGGHHRTSKEQNVKDLAYMLDNGHVNIYMFHGGTNFGFMNGSNYYDELTPDVTSYDYDAVLTEDGQITEKYKAFREEIGKRRQIPEVNFSTKILRKAYGELKSDKEISLWEALPQFGTPIRSVRPQSMEKLGQAYGYILYRTRIPESEELGKIRLMDANDRAKIYLGQKEVATLYDTELKGLHKVEPKASAPDMRLDILMENMGRVNFGPFMEKQRKGIDGPVLVNSHQVFDFEMIPLPLDNMDKLLYGEKVQEGPGFYHFTFDVEETGDTFINMTGWGKGCVFINGFSLGRFWEIGPQVSLYLPGPLLNKGKNEIVVFETEGKAPGTIRLEDVPNLGEALPEVIG
jgi:beta-galactosidase